MREQGGEGQGRLLCHRQGWACWGRRGLSEDLKELRARSLGEGGVSVGRVSQAEAAASAGSKETSIATVPSLRRPLLKITTQGQGKS